MPQPGSATWRSRPIQRHRPARKRFPGTPGKLSGPALLIQHRDPRLNICVWLFWLIPYTIGVLIGMPMFHLSDSMALTAAIAVVLVLGIFFCLKANKARLHR